jgi:hypothetical protein
VRRGTSAAVAMAVAAAIIGCGAASAQAPQSRMGLVSLRTEHTPSVASATPLMMHQPRTGIRHPVWQDPCLDARLRGGDDARHGHGSSGWLWGGAATGFLTGPVGVAVITIAAASSDPQPLIVPEGFDPVCYRVGWARHAHKRNTVAALVGSATGLAVGVAILTAIFAR